MDYKNDYNILNTLSDQKTQLILEKIKLEEKPEYKDFLNKYFNDPSKYFLKYFKNNPVVVGKKYNKNNSFKIKIELKKNQKKKLKKNITSKNDSKNISALDISSNSPNTANIPKELTNTKTNLKLGQRYIDDLELNEIFSNFKHYQKENKYKINNTLTINDIRKFRAENINNGQNIKNGILLRQKSIKLQKKLNILNMNENVNNNKTNNSPSTENNIENFKPPTRKTTFDQFPKYTLNMNSTDSLPSNKDNPFHSYQNNIYLKEKNTTIPNESLTSKSIIKLKHKNSNKNVLMTTSSKNYNKTYSYNFYKFYSSLNKSNKIDIFKKQNQYLTSEKYKNKIFRKELKKALVSQEKSFINNLNFKNKNLQISLFMSNKLKVPKEKLLMNKTEYYRINNDLKLKLSKQMKKEYIENFFKWEKSLKNFDNKKEYEEIIRDPNYMIKYSPIKKFYSYNNEYLVKRISKKNLQKFINNINNIKNNFRGLYIEGKNLLELEHEIAKDMKGKKILYNYEEVLPFSSLNEKVYAKNFQL